jgi:hypothetical protein
MGEEIEERGPAFVHCAAFKQYIAELDQLGLFEQVLVGEGLVIMAQRRGNDL